MKTFTVTVLSPERVLYDGPAEYLHVPGDDGWLGILADHAPLLASLRPGLMELRPPAPGKHVFLKTLRSGFLEVGSGGVSILLDAADSLAIEQAADRP